MALDQAYLDSPAWGDKPPTDEERRVYQFSEHENGVVANAFSFIVDSECSLAEYFEYLEDMDPSDFLKYYGTASVAEAKAVLGL